MTEGGQSGIKFRLSLLQQVVSPHLGEDDRDDDVENHRGEQGGPGHSDGRESQEQANDRGEGKDHDGVIERHLCEGEVGIAAGEPAPHEDHGGAGCGGEENKARDIAIELLRRKPRGKPLADE